MGKKDEKRKRRRKSAADQGSQLSRRVSQKERSSVIAKPERPVRRKTRTDVGPAGRSLSAPGSQAVSQQPRRSVRLMQTDPVLASALAEFQAGQRDRLRSMVTQLTEKGLSTPVRGAVRPAISLPPSRGHGYRAGALSGPTEHVSSPQVREGPTCKRRPKNNSPRGRGDGKRKFVPWCG